jgi:hypothetical protein
MVIRSLKPLPSRTINSCRSNSTSFTRRSLMHSIKRIPVPYNNLAINSGVPCKRSSKRLTSACVNTAGRRRGTFACSTLSSHGNWISSTSR